MFPIIPMRLYLTLSLLSIVIMWIMVNVTLYSACKALEPIQVDNQSDWLITPEIPFSEKGIADVNLKKTYLNILYLKPTLFSVVCREDMSQPILGIIVINSSPRNFILREIQRRSIPTKKLNELGFQRVFIIGQIRPNEMLVHQVQLQDEQDKYGDLVQGSFVDVTSFFTAKIIMALQWAMTNCAQAKFIIRINDNIIYDIFHVRQYLDIYQMMEPELSKSWNFFSGIVEQQHLVDRSLGSSQYVSMGEYSEMYFPDFCSGSFFITNPPTAKRLVEAAEYEPLLWLDNVWVTGILRTRLLIPIQVITSWFSAESQYLHCCLRDIKAYNYTCDYHLGLIDEEDEDFFKFYIKLTERCYKNKCTRPPSNYILEDNCLL